MEEEIINKEKEYRKIFMYQKRWAKHWTTSTAHRAHSSTGFMTEAAYKTLEAINEIETKEVCNYEKLCKLMGFYIKKNEEEEKVNNRMYNCYYFNCCQYLKREMNKVEHGNKATIYKMPRA